MLKGLGHVEPHIGHTVGGHGQHGGQEQALSDVRTTGLGGGART